MLDYIINLIGKKIIILFKVDVIEDKNMSVIADQSNESHSQFAGSAMTKAGRLAMELSKEKKDLSKN